MNNLLREALFLILLILFAPAIVMAQVVIDTSSPEEQLLDRVKGESFYLTSLIQAGGNLSLLDDHYLGGQTFRVANARFGVGGQLSRNFEYRAQMNFAREPNLLDAHLTWRGGRQFNLRVGAQKPEISSELIPSAGTTDFIQRARLVGVNFNSREIGASIFGDFGPIGYSVGIYNGVGLDQNHDNRFIYTGRLLYRFAGGVRHRFEVGVNLLTGICRDQICSLPDLNMNGRRVTYGGDLRYETTSWFFAGEILLTHAEIFDNGFGQERVDSGYITAGRNLTDRLMILARWDYLSYNQIDELSSLFIAGFNYQPTRLIRMQFNLQYLTDKYRDDRAGALAVFQVRF